MLLGKNFRRRHDGGLPAIAHGTQRRQRCHNRLPRAHITLHQAQHWQRFLQIIDNVADHPFLGGGQGKRQYVPELPVERLTQR